MNKYIYLLKFCGDIICCFDKEEDVLTVKKCLQESENDPDYSYSMVKLYSDSDTYLTEVFEETYQKIKSRLTSFELASIMHHYIDKNKHYDNKMSAEDFLYHKNRMCKTYLYNINRCIGCPMNDSDLQGNLEDCDEVFECEPEAAVKAVEKWVKENPEKK